MTPPLRTRRGADDPAIVSLPDWSALFGRLADNLVRVVRAEIMLLESRLSHSFADTLGRVAARVAGLMVLALSSMLGLICLLAGYILLLHRWLPAWQACGIGGVTIIVVGLILFAIFNASARRGTASG
ncbi:MAG TPA: phage holin family protein [Candidatus Binataceae bacterium]|nr:phage holin family protein [Candidatus Binataceae bacterium]